MSAAVVAASVRRYGIVAAARAVRPPAQKALLFMFILPDECLNSSR
jgi:hypothetical protein